MIEQRCHPNGNVDLCELPTGVASIIDVWLVDYPSWDMEKVARYIFANIPSKDRENFVSWLLKYWNIDK